jgi:hypothetical protein
LRGVRGRTGREKKKVGYTDIQTTTLQLSTSMYYIYKKNREKGKRKRTENTHIQRNEKKNQKSNGLLRLDNDQVKHCIILLASAYNNLPLMVWSALREVVFASPIVTLVTLYRVCWMISIILFLCPSNVEK